MQFSKKSYCEVSRGFKNVISKSNIYSFGKLYSRRFGCMYGEKLKIFFQNWFQLKHIRMIKSTQSPKLFIIDCKTNLEFYVHI